MKKVLLVIGGLIALVLGCIGIVLPILPTCPFLIVSSICFLNSSERLNEWFKKTKIYNKHVKSFKESGGLTLKAKLSILIPVYIVLGFLFVYKDILAMRITIAVLLIIKTIVFIKMPTIKNNKKAEVLND